MMLTFADKRTMAFYHGDVTKDTRKIPPDIQKRALRLLDVVDKAFTLDDIAVYPGTRLEKKSGDLQAFFGIRVNDQWRILFRWEEGNAFDVQLIDYH